jgi:DNA-binding response OmpR family regulator
MARCRVLVVEDEPDIQHVIRLTVEAAGHDVIEAASLAEAFQALTAERIEVFVVDRLLPDGDGLDLCRAIRGRHASVPVLVVTAWHEAGDGDAATAAGATEVLLKPFDPDALAASVDRLCASAPNGSAANGAA